MKKFSILILLIISIMITSCSPKEKNENKGEQNTTENTAGNEEVDKGSGKLKDTLIFAQGADVTSLDPHVGKETPAITVTSHIFDTLTNMNEKNEIIPGIAESWEQLSETSYEFKLKEGIKFHDGSELTAEDVKFSLDRAINSSYVAYIVDFIDNVEVKDDYTVLVTTKKPYAPILRNLAHPSAAIVPKAIVEANDEILKTSPIGSGPYKFVEWKQGESVKLEAFEDYYNGVAATKYIEMKVIPEASQRTIALQTGEIDLAYDPTITDSPLIQEDENLSLATTPTSSVAYLSFNTELKPFDNEKVRQAFAHAIDKKLIVDTLLQGEGSVAEAIVNSVVFGGFDDVQGLEYNPEKAKELLKEAGVAEGTKFTVMVNDNQLRIEACQVIQDMLKKVGIELEVKSSEFGSFIKATSNKEHEIAFFAWVTSTSDADYTYYPLFHSTMMGAQGNRSFYSNPKVDELIEKGRITANDDERLEVYKELADIIAKELPSLPLYFQNTSVGKSNKVEGFVISPIGYHRLENIKVYE